VKHEFDFTGVHVKYDIDLILTKMRQDLIGTKSKSKYDLIRQESNFVGIEMKYKFDLGGIQVKHKCDRTRITIIDNLYTKKFSKLLIRTICSPYYSKNINPIKILQNFTTSWKESLALWSSHTQLA
jgi:hypothetical protein